MKWFMCKSTLKYKLTNFVAEQLEKSVDKMKDAMTEIAVVHYSDRGV